MPPNGAILLLNYAGEYLAHYTRRGAAGQRGLLPRRPVCPLRQRGGTPPGYENGTDPQGSVTIVDLEAETPTPNTVTFEAGTAAGGPGGRQRPAEARPEPLHRL